MINFHINQLRLFLREMEKPFKNKTFTLLDFDNILPAPMTIFVQDKRTGEMTLKCGKFTKYDKFDKRKFITTISHFMEDAVEANKEQPKEMKRDLYWNKDLTVLDNSGKELCVCNSMESLAIVLGKLNE